MRSRRVLGLVPLFLISAFGPCDPEAGAGAPASRSEEGAEAERASATPAPSCCARVHTTQAPAEPEPPPAEPSPVDSGALRFEPIPLLSPIDAEVLAHVRRLAEAAPELHDDRVAKMGGSSVESRAFLHCFEGDEVDLGGRDALRPTLDAFRRSASGVNSFARESLATRVGWSIRSGMGGRPPYVQRELVALRPRWALAFFGGNDVMGKQEGRYAERLERLIASIEARGVVPILGSIPPRRRDRSMNRWVERYNRVTWATARVHRLPYIDFHQVFVDLPGMGLARDGVHPDVLVRGPRSAPCDFGAEGLEHGQNQRNLRVLEMLDHLRRVYSLGEQAPPARPALSGEGTPEAPFHVVEAPFAQGVDAAALEGSALGGYSGCGEHPGEGPELVYRVRVEAPVRLWVSAYGLGPIEASVFLLGEDPDPRACRAALEDDAVVALEPGVYHLVVETAARRRARDASSSEARLLVVMTGAPSEAAEARRR
jgi:hypothetical protein